jgi:hypothetical protein
MSDTPASPLLKFGPALAEDESVKSVEQFLQEMINLCQLSGIHQCAVVFAQETFDHYSHSLHTFNMSLSEAHFALTMVQRRLEHQSMEGSEV